MARPVCKGFCREWRLISLLQRIRPRRSSFRPRWRYARPSPHKSPGVKMRRFLNQASRTPFDCQAISSSPSRKHLLAVGCFASDQPNTMPSSTLLSRQNVLHASVPPRRSWPACWRRRRPRHCDGHGSRALSPIDRAAHRAQPHRAAPRALRGSTACADTCCRAC
jgi:hypothetical protein